MAKKVPEGKRFKPGESGNPNGRPPTSPETKYIRKLTQEKLEEIGDLILNGDKPKLNEIAASLTEPAIRVIYAKAAVNAMTKGDLTNLELILNRVLGKVREKTEVDATLKLIVEDYSKK